MNKATITICGKQVNMLYCAAAETGYEQLSGNSSEVFIPQIATNVDGESIVQPPKAKLVDYIYLAFASIIASYARTGKETPVSAEDILYEASPSEVTELVTTIVKLRKNWYDIPNVVEQPPSDEDTGEQQKNA